MTHLRNRSVLSSLLLAGALALVACDDEPSGAADGGAGGAGGTTPGPDGGAAACPAGGGNGQLMVSVSAPVPLTPQLRVVGGGIAGSMPVVAGTPLSLPAGSGYAVQSRRVKVAPAAGDFVGRAYYLTSSTFDGCIRAGQTAMVTLTYALEPGSGKVWVLPSNGAGVVAAYDEGQLDATAEQTPVVVRRMGITSARDLAFDATGNMWVAGGNEGIFAYPMATLGEAADRRPALRLMGLGGDAIGLAFDADGALWVGLNVPGGMDRVVKLAPADLAIDAAATMTVSRSATPMVSLTSAELDGPAQLAFDMGGDLWLTSQAKDAVLKLAATQLSASAAVAPAVKLTARVATGPIQGAYRGPAALSFDGMGNLWVGWLGSVARFTPAQLGATAEIRDPLDVRPMGEGPAGVSPRPHAFDATGGLWFSRTNLGSAPAALVRVPPAGLGASGMPDTMPDMKSPGLGNGAGRIVFNPTPPGLPIRD